MGAILHRMLLLLTTLVVVAALGAGCSSPAIDDLAARLAPWPGIRALVVDAQERIQRSASLGRKPDARRARSTSTTAQGVRLGVRYPDGVAELYDLRGCSARRAR